MQITAKQRIEAYIAFKKISTFAFERTCGLSNGYLTKLTKSPTLDKVESIIKAYPDINPLWMMLGEGTMLREDQSKIDIKLERVQEGNDYTYIEGCSDSALAAKLREAQREIEHLKDKIKDRDARISELKTCNEFLMAQANK